RKRALFLFPRARAERGRDAVGGDKAQVVARRGVTAPGVPEPDDEVGRYFLDSFAGGFPASFFASGLAAAAPSFLPSSAFPVSGLPPVLAAARSSRSFSPITSGATTSVVGAVPATPSPS